MFDFYQKQKPKILGYKLSEIMVNTYYGNTKYEERVMFYKTKEKAIRAKNDYFSGWLYVYDDEDHLVAEMCNENELAIAIARKIGLNHITEIRLIVSEVYD